jgi:fluoroacetyl-CoA thioesterase
MKAIYSPGDSKTYTFVVQEHDTATFEAGQVHPVCATFTLAREVEWASRLFVLDMIEEGEEGIGTMLLINHIGPARVGSQVEVTATVQSQKKNELICSFTASVGTRVVARGETGQKIVKKEKLKELFASI